MQIKILYMQYIMWKITKKLVWGGECYLFLCIIELLQFTAAVSLVINCQHCLCYSSRSLRAIKQEVNNWDWMQTKWLSYPGLRHFGQKINRGFQAQLKYYRSYQWGVKAFALDLLPRFIADAIVIQRRRLISFPSRKYVPSVLFRLNLQ